MAGNDWKEAQATKEDMGVRTEGRTVIVSIGQVNAYLTPADAFAFARAVVRAAVFGEGGRK